MLGLSLGVPAYHHRSVEHAIAQVRFNRKIVLLANLVLFSRFILEICIIWCNI